MTSTVRLLVTHVMPGKKVVVSHVWNNGEKRTLIESFEPMTTSVDHVVYDGGSIEVVEEDASPKEAS